MIRTQPTTGPFTRTYINIPVKYIYIWLPSLSMLGNNPLTVKRRKSYSSYIYYNNICGQLNSSTGGLAALSLSLLGTQKRIINCLVLLCMSMDVCTARTPPLPLPPVVVIHLGEKKASRFLFLWKRKNDKDEGWPPNTVRIHLSLFFSRFLREKI